MSDSNQCPECGAGLPRGATEGLCPKCLMAAALQESDEVVAEEKASPFAATTPQPAGFVPPDPEELVPLFPQLEILELLGHGGMGAVYKARQTKLDRLVALKILRPESADDPAFAERFMREARTLARLNHPHIVAVHDFGEVVPVRGQPQRPVEVSQPSGRLYYFIMEYVDGASLRQLIQSGRLQPEEALAIVPQICEALQFAHEEGIVHRDIKPENILLDAKGRVKIADFGLAKLAARSPEEFTLTATHQVMGTPRYMAPEQMTGSHAVDHRADIYSLGVVFYEMLTGEVPMGSFDPPSRKVPVDARLDEVVLRAMAREPERRYQHAVEIRSDVEAITSTDSLLSQSVMVLDPYSLGASTILERGVGRIINAAKPGMLRRFFTHPAIPGILAMLLSFGGVATIFVPWGLIPANPIYKWTYAYDHAWGLLAGIVFFALGLAMLASTTSVRRPAWRPWTIMASGAVNLVYVALFYENVFLKSSVIGGSFFTAFAFSIALMLVGAWDLRCLFAQREAADSLSPPGHLLAGHAGVLHRVRMLQESGTSAPKETENIPDPVPAGVDESVSLSNDALTVSEEHDAVAVQSEIDGPSLALIVVGLLMLLGSTIGAFILPVPASLTYIPGAIVGVMMMLGGLSLRKFWSPGWAMIGALAGLVPLSPGWLLSAPVCFWAVKVLNRPHIRRAFVEEARRHRRRAQEATAPRFSRKAILGACWAPLIIGFPLSFAPVQGPNAPWPAPWQWPLVFTIGPLGAMAPFATTILGILALSNIRHSGERLTGRGLAFFDAVFFPTLILNALMIGGPPALLRLTVGLTDSYLLTSLLIALPMTILVDVLVLWRLWRRQVVAPGRTGGSLDGESSSELEDNSDRNSAEQPAAGRDWVTLTRAQIDNDELPDLCMVCGRPARERINKTFEHQPDWAGILTIIGMLAGVFPGLIIAALTSTQIRVACPVCDDHRNHFSRLVWTASLGWLLVVALGGIGFVVSLAAAGSDVEVQIAGTAIGLGIGLIIWVGRIIYLASTRVGVESIKDGVVRFQRVSGAFARAVPRAPGTLPVDHRTRPGEEQDDATPRFSRKAILGMLLIPACAVSIALSMFAIAGTPASFFLATCFGLPGIIIPFLTTFLGIAALSDIRHSNGRLTGLGLALADTLFFPLLILNGAIFGPVLLLSYDEVDFAMALSLALGTTGIIGGGLSIAIIRRVWSVVSGPVDSDIETKASFRSEL